MDARFHQVHVEKGVAMLDYQPIVAGEHLQILFHDGHTEKGHVVAQCCVKGLAPKMFVPVHFHGKYPWILIEGMKARRLPHGL